MGCCGKTEKEENGGAIPAGGIDTNRGCTDVICILLFVAAMAAWVAIASIAFHNGKPLRVVKPMDYKGNICGEDKEVANRPYLYLPSPWNLNFGLCVTACPNPDDIVCKYNSSSNTSLALFKVASSDCFLTFYKSSPALWRCFPTQVLNVSGISLATEQLQKITDTFSVGKYLQQGYADVYNGRWVIFISVATALGFTLLWVFLLRFLVKPVVWFTIIAVFCLLFGLGWASWQRANHLRDTVQDGDKDSKRQVTTFRVLSWIFWIASAIYLTLLAWLLSRVRIAIEIVKEASKCLSAARSMVLVTPVSFAFLCLLTAWWVAIGVFIQGIGNIEDIDFHIEEVLNSTGSTVINATSFKYKYFQKKDGILAMQIYNIFAFFWSMHFILALGYFTIVSTVVSWYFSARCGQEKSVALTVVAQSFWRGVRYHLGSLMFGSLIIAIIQTVRFVLNFMMKKLEPFKSSAASKFILCIINCLFNCLERIINFINRNAYIMVAIRGKGFCQSAAEALKLLVANIIRVSCTNFISSFVLFLCKGVILISNLYLASKLLDTSIATGPVDSGLFPLFLIACITFSVATMFLNLFDDCIDALLLCFFLDSSQDGDHYMPEALAKLVGKYEKIERLRVQAEKMMSMQADDVEKVPDTGRASPPPPHQTRVSPAREASD
eukprot:TRINITY_DN11298_c0_g1_i1.p1 TRINITY_DN11298_c0_g1~~TRINITY_DN11298_c0_g1_i1.p1  ORF type:complete len:665 (-),score=119.59 TRINITY_DN11298_c0_g1_i1:201-2195(-)